MLIYPQLGSGALSQFPSQKRRRTRTVVNRAQDGTTVRLPDTLAHVTEWELKYSGLTDEEATVLWQFFEDAEGTLNSFTFLDPMGNLLAWSEKLDEEVWQHDPLLSLNGGVTDPNGGTEAWNIANSGGGVQALRQTLSAPAAYLYCFSAYVRSAQSGSLSMQVGSGRYEKAISNDWRRIAAVGSGDANAEAVTFGIEAPAGATFDIFGLQVDAGTGASVYQRSMNGGVYEGARMAEDTLSITTTAENSHSCTVKIIHANHL
jgi:hypothetical protein